MKQSLWKKKLFLVGMCIMLIMGLSACQQKPEQAEGVSEVESKNGIYQTLSAEKAMERMEANPEILIVDVRTEEEYKEGHIPGAILIPNEGITVDKPGALPDLDAEIFVYCRSGRRSKEAAEKLVNLGYTNVYDIGGVIDWPYELTKDDERVPSFSNFTAEDVEGNAVNQEIFSEYDLNMIYIWATFCKQCQDELADMSALNKEYADKKFQVVGIVMDAVSSDGENYAQLEEAQRMIETSEANFKNLLPSSDLIYAKLFQITGVPEVVFVNKAGEVVGEAYQGTKTKEQWKSIIEELFEKYVRNEE